MITGYLTALSSAPDHYFPGNHSRVRFELLVTELIDNQAAEAFDVYDKATVVVIPSDREAKRQLAMQLLEEVLR